MSIRKNEIESFKDLIVWEKSHYLILQTYKLTKNFPSDEKFGLVNQIRRAAVSITSNIAEGFARNTAKDKNHFYAISKGSLLEVQNQLLIAKDLGYIGKEDAEKIDEQIIEIAKMISGLIKSSVDK